MSARPATPDDAPRIAEIARETWHAAYDGFLGAETVDALIDEWYAPDRLEDDVAGTPHYFVADEGTDDEGRGDDRAGTEDDGGGIVGYAAGSTDAEERLSGQAVLDAIYVRPDYWGRGIGSRLLARVARSVGDDGADELAAVVLADNEVGRAFYERHGFETVERREEELAGEPVAELVVVADVERLR